MNGGQAEERWPLSGREYFAIRQLFAIVSSYEHSMTQLEKRAKAIPGAWRDLKMLSAKSENLIAALLRTVPANKLQQIQRELGSTTVTVEVKGAANSKLERGAFQYVPCEALETLIQHMIDWECFSCEKCGKEAKKCPYRETIEACFPYEMSFKDKEYCAYSGMNIQTEEAAGE